MDGRERLSGCLLVFIKSPEKGTVKSRLAGAIGEKQARKLYRSFVLDILETLEKTAAEGRYTLKLYFHPPESGKAIAGWLGNKYDFRPQRGKDLGERMQNAFLEVFSEGFDPALLIGSDIPDLPEKMIADGFASLQNNGAVIGPSLDGGYYLIGFRSPSFLPEAFADIPWDTGGVFERTIEILKRSHDGFSILPAQRDMDTCADLKDLLERHQSSYFTNSRTMRYLLSQRWTKTL
jgi:rSAM/selenodomain-associated transferase 1